MIGLEPAVAEYVLALADDEHLIGARHTRWIGLGPFLEEDLAFCSIAQDELGHAVSLYGLLTDDVDRYALLRPAGEYRSCWLAEWPCTDWHDALVRHWLYDRAEQHRWGALEASSIEPLRLLAAQAEREESFHRAHAEELLSRITSAEGDGRRRIVDALDRLLPLALGLWDPVAGEEEAVAADAASARSTELEGRWADDVRADLARWGVDVDWPSAGPDQQARTVRSAHFDELHASITEVISIDPAAAW